MNNIILGVALFRLSVAKYQRARFENSLPFDKEVTQGGNLILFVCEEEFEIK